MFTFSFRDKDYTLNCVGRLDLSGSGCNAEELDALLKSFAEKELSRIRYLVLDNNQISVLPASILALENLRILSLKSNPLEALPDKIYCLQKLKRLDVSGGNLRELPPGIGCLQDLDTLNVSSNDLQDLPESLKFLTKLGILNLKGNRITALPLGVAQLPKLKVLGLSRAPLATPADDDLHPLPATTVKTADLPPPKPVSRCESLMALCAKVVESAGIPFKDEYGLPLDLKIFLDKGNHFYCYAGGHPIYDFSWEEDFRQCVVRRVKAQELFSRRMADSLPAEIPVVGHCCPIHAVHSIGSMDPVQVATWV